MIFSKERAGEEMLGVPRLSPPQEGFSCPPQQDWGFGYIILGGSGEIPAVCHFGVRVGWYGVSSSRSCVWTCCCFLPSPLGLQIPNNPTIHPPAHHPSLSYDPGLMECNMEREGLGKAHPQSLIWQNCGIPPCPPACPTAGLGPGTPSGMPEQPWGEMG